jgi:hypothetical protein
MSFDIANNEHLEHTELVGESPRHVDRATGQRQRMSAPSPSQPQTD